MTHGDGTIVLGDDGDDGMPEAPGSTPAGPHDVYLVVEDVEAHYERTAAANAEIVYPPEDTEFGTRRYPARDPEGYEWSFGTYVPGASG